MCTPSLNALNAYMATLTAEYVELIGELDAWQLWLKENVPDALGELQYYALSERVDTLCNDKMQPLSGLIELMGGE